MGIFNDKRNILNTISTLNSLKNNENNPINNFNSYFSVSTSKNVSEFLVDLLISLGGKDVIINVFSNLFTNYTKEYETKIKDIFIKELLDYDSNNILPTEFVNNGYNINIKNIDTFNDFLIQKNDSFSSLVYDNNFESFNNKIYEAINTPLTNVKYSRLIFNYNDNTELLNIKPDEGINTVRDLIYSYVFSFNEINKKQLVNDIFNSVFGVFYKYKNLSKNQLKENLEIDNIINKIINSENDINIDENNLISINNKIEDLYNQNYIIDIGCGFIENNISLTDISTFANNMSNNITEFENSLDIFIDSNLNDFNTVTKENIKLNLLKLLIEEFKKTLIKYLFLSAEKKVLFILINKFKEIEFTDNFNFINKNINTINCIKTDIDSRINEYIFDYVKKLLIDLTKPIAQKIINENIKNYTNIIKNLVI